MLHSLYLVIGARNLRITYTGLVACFVAFRNMSSSYMGNIYFLHLIIIMCRTKINKHKEFLSALFYY
jgi:hypothetical protein